MDDDTNKPFVDKDGNYTTYIVMSENHSDRYNRFYFPDFVDFDDVEALKIEENTPEKNRRETIKDCIFDLSLRHIHDKGALPDKTPYTVIKKIYGHFVENIKDNIYIDIVQIPNYQQTIDCYNQKKSIAFIKETLSKKNELKSDARRSFWMIAIEIDEREGSLNALEPVPFTMNDQGYHIYFPEFDDDLKSNEHRYYDQVMCSETDLINVAQEKLIGRIKQYYSKNIELPKNMTKEETIKSCRADFGADFFESEDDDEDGDDDTIMFQVTLDFQSCINVLTEANIELDKINKNNTRRLNL